MYGDLVASVKISLTNSILVDNAVVLALQHIVMAKPAIEGSDFF